MAQRMSPKSLENIQNEMLSSSEWYADVLLDAVTGRFKDASAFFDALKRARCV